MAAYPGRCPGLSWAGLSGRFWLNGRDIAGRVAAMTEGELEAVGERTYTATLVDRDPPAQNATADRQCHEAGKAWECLV